MQTADMTIGLILGGPKGDTLYVILSRINQIAELKVLANCRLRNRAVQRSAMYLPSILLIRMLLRINARRQAL